MEDVPAVDLEEAFRKISHSRIVPPEADMINLNTLWNTL